MYKLTKKMKKMNYIICLHQIKRKNCKLKKIMISSINHRQVNIKLENYRNLKIYVISIASFLMVNLINLNMMIMRKFIKKKKII
jgi:hypothetical protein